jgi:2-aminoethylphosphonate-pyruvate transaminase
MASAQKGLMSMTGLSYVIGNTKKLEESKDYPKRSYYCNLYMQYSFIKEKGEMHFTPPVQTIYATIQAMKEYWEVGEQAKWERHQRIWEALYKGLDRLGFQTIIPKEKQSKLVVSIKYPNDANWSFTKVHDYVYERGFTIYPGKVSDMPTFRLCALGTIDAPDVDDFFEVLEQGLKEMNIQVPIKY